MLLQSPVYAQSDRKVTNINRGWLFRQGESSSAITTAKAKAEGWKEVNLPHDFQIEQPWVAPAADEKARAALLCACVSMIYNSISCNACAVLALK